MTLTKEEIRDSAKNRVANEPASLTDAIILEYVEDACRELSNALGVTITTSAIPDAYGAVLEDMTVVTMQEYIIGDLVKKSVSIGGDISVNYSDIANSLRGISERLEAGIEAQIDQLGRKREFEYTEY
jgi:hypothetical protein